MKSAKKEIMFLFPTVNAVVRQTKAGIMDLIKEAASNYNVSVRILLPGHEITRSSTVGLVNDNDNNQNITIRFIEHDQSGKATLLIVDSKECLMMELKDDRQSTFCGAIGLSVHSNSRAGILSYASMFESLWRQTELYEKLKEQDKIQREFINIAAHELRTPVQLLLGIADIFMAEFEKCNEEEKMQQIEVSKAVVEIIARNARRLERLTSDILDASRIESNALKLNEEIIDLNQKIRHVVDDERFDMIEGKRVSIIFNQKEISPLLIRRDKLRLFRVLSNMMGNAIKFTGDGGTITIMCEKKPDAEEAVITIRDTGKRIDPEILRRLFTKFASKSDSGTGLGLYLSKGRVDAHGGKISARNDEDGRGATFSLILPLESQPYTILLSGNPQLKILFSVRLIFALIIIF